MHNLVPITYTKKSNQYTEIKISPKNLGHKELAMVDATKDRRCREKSVNRARRSMKAR